MKIDTTAKTATIGFFCGVTCAMIALMLVSSKANADVFGADPRIYVGSQVVTNDTETVQLGLSLEWDYVAVDMSHGIKRVSWRVESEPSWKMDEWQSGSVFSIRGYPYDLNERWRPLVTWVHLSDVTRGRPFNDKEEPTSDYLGVGVTYVRKDFEFDVSWGISGRECDVFDCFSESVTTEFQIGLRGYF